MSTEIQAPRTTEMTLLSPMQMIQVAFNAAIEQGGALEVVDRILEQQKWMIKHQEEQEFNEALERIQSKLKIVVKDSSIPGKGKYASSAAVDKAILELCREEKITLSFDTEDSGASDLLRFVCDASLGAYRKRYTLPLPVDGAGAKGGGVMNKTDATLAAVTKGKRYLKNMIFNLRIEESDEGNVIGGVTNEQAGEWLEAIRDAATPELTMSLWLQSVEVAKRQNPIDYKAMTVFTEARDKRLKELKKSK